MSNEFEPDERPKLETTRERVESWIHSEERNQKERIQELTLRDARELLVALRAHRFTLAADIHRIDATKKLIKSELLSEGAAE